MKKKAYGLFFIKKNLWVSISNAHSDSKGWYQFYIVNCKLESG